jgi:hypothetical protein
VSWVDVQDAMHASIVQASGYPKDSVVWSYQNVGERDMPYVRIHFGGETMVDGLDWIKRTTDLTRPRGQEIKQEVQGVREVPLMFEVFTSETLGDTAARRVAERIRAKMLLESIRDRLARANVVAFGSSGVEYLPTIYGANFRGRAVCTLRCYVPVMDCYEYVGYIARVRGTVRATDGVTTYTRTFDSLLGGADPTMFTSYYGLAVPATIDETFVKALSDSSLEHDFARTYVFSAGDGTKKAYVAFLASFGTPTTFTDAATGFAIPNTKVGTAISVTGEDGIAREYSVYATVDLPLVAFNERLA